MPKGVAGAQQWAPVFLIVNDRVWAEEKSSRRSHNVLRAIGACIIYLCDDFSRAGVCSGSWKLDASWHAHLQAQSEHRLRHSWPSVHGMSLLPSNPANPPQAYLGALNTVGIDIGITAGGVLGWAVLAPTVGIPAGALAGEYVGASGDLIGLGAGANVLIGGSGRTFALQPVSVEGSIAVNVTLGVSGLKLRAAF